MTSDTRPTDTEEPDAPPVASAAALVPDAKPSPETDSIEDEGDPIGANFA